MEQLEREEKEELQSISRELDENLEDWEQRKAEVREHQRKWQELRKEPEVNTN